MKQYSVFIMTMFYTGIIEFNTPEEIKKHLAAIEMPGSEWTCNDEGHEMDVITRNFIKSLDPGPGNGATFTHQLEPDDFKNYLHIQRNY